MNKGKIIVVEGACDGVGKSSQSELLEKYLINNGYQVVKHHFPTYNTYQGKGVEEYLAGNYGEAKDLSPYFINDLYAIDRAITWYSELKKEYDAGKVILLDRYTTSSLIYQAALIEDLDKRKEFINYISDFEYEKLGIQKPDLVIFLHAPYDLVSELRKKRVNNEGVSNDIHERNDSFMKKVYDNAMFLADYLNWNKIKCNNGDTMKSIEEIHLEIVNSLRINKR